MCRTDMRKDTNLRWEDIFQNFHLAGLGYAHFKNAPDEIPVINPVKVSLYPLEGEMAATREACMEVIEGLEWDISTLNWAGQDDGGG